jgi:hypothetical protein
VTVTLHSPKSTISAKNRPLEVVKAISLGLDVLATLVI